MFEGFSRSDPLCMVVYKHFREQVEGIVAAEGLGFWFDELVPGLNRVSRLYLYILSQQFQVLLIEFKVVFLEILEQIVGSQYLSDLYKLIAVAVSHKERLFLEDLRQSTDTIEANMAPVDQMSSE